MTRLSSREVLQAFDRALAEAQERAKLKVSKQPGKSGVTGAKKKPSRSARRLHEAG